MSNQDDIPVLNDLIERGVEITMSDLGLDDDAALRVSDVEAELAFEADDVTDVEAELAFEADDVTDVEAELVFEADDTTDIDQTVIDQTDIFSNYPFTDDAFTDDPIADPHFRAAATLATPLAGNPVVPASVSEVATGLQVNAADALADNPALEQAVRRILDEHMELAWHEIRLAIQQHLDRS